MKTNNLEGIQGKQETPVSANMDKKTESKKSVNTATGFSVDESTDTGSDFTGNLRVQFQEKVQQMTDYFKNTDPEKIIAEIRATSKVLFDNLLAGETLARGETYALLQFLVLLLIIRDPGSTDSLITFILGPVTLVTGLSVLIKDLNGIGRDLTTFIVWLLCYIAAYDLGKEQLSPWPAPVPSGVLKTQGLYQLVRHPMYSGVILASLGFAGSTGSSERLILSLGLTYILIKKVEAEEAFLEKTFGEEFKDYCQKVRYKIIPKLY
eukprot:jgi/Galph1/4698/GphlegSOOS_G3398.1